MLNVATPRPRCTQIEASYNLGNEENKSATLNIRSVKCWDPPPDRPPMVEPVAATPAPALVANEPPDPPPNVKPVASTPAASAAAGVAATGLALGGGLGGSVATGAGAGVAATGLKVGGGSGGGSRHLTLLVLSVAD